MPPHERDTSPVHADPTGYIRVLRLEEGNSEIIRTLANSYKGCYTHYKGVSHFCPGERDCDYHSLDRTWRGYTPVEAWNAAQQLWVPWVLEISECLDHDFHGRFCAGQVWELSKEKRPEKQGKKKKASKPPLRGRLLEERDPRDFPPPFAMDTVLAHLFHSLHVVLDKDNPMPRRLVAAPSRGAPPVDPVKREVVPEQSQEDFLKFKKALQDKARRMTHDSGS